MPAGLFGKHGKVSVDEMCTFPQVARRTQIPPVSTLELELEEKINIINVAAY